MSARVDTDMFGRALNLPKFPFTVIKQTRDDMFVNVTGDKMTGILNMSKNRITNIAAPTNKFDSANKGYVDSMKDKTLTALQDKFGKAVSHVSTKIAANRKQDLALKDLITKLQDTIEKEPSIKILKSKMTRSKDISTLVITWDKKHSITKNIVLFQILIEGDKNTWLDLQSLNSHYGFYVYERFNKSVQKHELYISTNKTLPESWRCNMLITCKILNVGINFL